MLWHEGVMWEGQRRLERKVIAPLNIARLVRATRCRHTPLDEVEIVLFMYGAACPQSRILSAMDSMLQYDQPLTGRVIIT